MPNFVATSEEETPGVSIDDIPKNIISNIGL